LPLLGIGYAAMLYEIGLKRFAGTVLFVALTLNLLLFDQFIYSLINMGLGMVLLVQAVRHQRKDPFVIGGLLVATGLLKQLALAIDIFSFNHWGVLTVLGISAVLTASLLERHGSRLRQWRQQLDNWNGRA